MKRFINKVMGAASQFKELDFALFKIYMVAIGILLGSYFAPFWIEHIIIIWTVAILAGVYTIIQLLRYATKR